MPTDADYTINDLARLTGLNVRTIRYWIAQGLLPASGESGPGAHYGRGHLDRLQLIKRLQAEYLPNAEIRRRLAPLSDGDVAALLGESGAGDPGRPTTTALEYVRGLLEQAAPRIASPTPVLPAPSAPAVSVAREAKVPPAMRVGASPAAEGASPSATEAPARMPPPPIVGRIVELREAPAGGPDDGDAARTPMPERSQWERLSLGPNIELHIRRPLSRPEQRRVERLITIARQVLDERNAP